MTGVPLTSALGSWGGGLILLAATAVALIWANSSFSDSYSALWHTQVTLELGSWRFSQDLHFWVNDILMTLFFLVVGMEIRREIHDGALSDWRSAMLPICAALSAITLPALIYAAMNPDPKVLMGWAIPTATDIAFAVGVLAVGLYPKPLTDLMDAPIAQLVVQQVGVAQAQGRILVQLADGARHGQHVAEEEALHGQAGTLP